MSWAVLCWLLRLRATDVGPDAPLGMAQFASLNVAADASTVVVPKWMKNFFEVLKGPPMAFRTPPAPASIGLLSLTSCKAISSKLSYTFAPSTGTPTDTAASTSADVRGGGTTSRMTILEDTNEEKGTAPAPCLSCRPSPCRVTTAGAQAGISLGVTDRTAGAVVCSCTPSSVKSNPFVDTSSDRNPDRPGTGRQVATLSDSTNPAVRRPPNRQKKSGVPENPPPCTVTTEPPDARMARGVTMLTKGSAMPCSASCAEQKP